MVAAHEGGAIEPPELQLPEDDQRRLPSRRPDAHL